MKQKLGSVALLLLHSTLHVQTTTTNTAVKTSLKYEFAHNAINARLFSPTQFVTSERILRGMDA